MKLLPQELLLHISSYLDVKSLKNGLGLTNKKLRSIALETLPEIEMREAGLLRRASEDYRKRYGYDPFFRIGGDSARDFFASESFNIKLTKRFHKSIQRVLYCINLFNRKEDLNIVTGQDLLYTVGRLSMMIADEDFLPFWDSRPFPVNWTTETFLRGRMTPRRQELGFAPQHVSNTLQALNRYRGSKEHYKHSGFKEFYGGLSGALFKMKDSQQKSKDSVLKRLHLESLAPTLMQFLDKSSFLNLALTNKSFLMIASMYPVQKLSHESPRVQTVVDLVFRAAKALKAGNFQPLQVQNLGQLEALLSPRVPIKFLPYNKNTAKIPGGIVLGGNENKRIMFSPTPVPRTIPSKDLETFTGHIDESERSFPYSMKLHLGRELNRSVSMVNTGALRLIFSQGVEILKLVDPKNKNNDLSYENIVKYLNMVKDIRLRSEIDRVFRAPGSVSPLIGELAILLVGIEGSQNNLMVLHAPMVLDLVRSGQMTWDEALFLGERQPNLKSMPWFAFASDQSQKGGKGVMERQAALLQNEAFDEERYQVARRVTEREEDLELTPEEQQAQGYDTFRDVFMAREFMLQRRFIATFFPEIFETKFFSEEALLDTLEYLIEYYMLYKFCRSSTVSMDQLSKFWRTFRQKYVLKE
jgi:hypothetical protein